jgi:mono/diheme cytochrome c family protein
MTMTRATRAVLLALLVFSLGALALAGCGGGDDEEGGGETPAATTGEEATTEEATTEEATTEEATTEETTEAGGDAAAGEQVFADNGCGNCHTLAAAGSTGTTGPNLDELQPDFDAVVEQVTNGGGAMPAFGGDLSEQQINDVAAYVSESAGG